MQRKAQEHKNQTAWVKLEKLSNEQQACYVPLSVESILVCGGIDDTSRVELTIEIKC